MIINLSAFHKHCTNNRKRGRNMKNKRNGNIYYVKIHFQQSLFVPQLCVFGENIFCFKSSGT